MKITLFQALTVFLKRHRVPAIVGKKLQRIYLNGVKTHEENKLILSLLESPLLKQYEITNELEDIVKDSTRRFFESMLMVDHLSNTLDELELSDLLRLADLEFNKMDAHFKKLVPRTVFINQNLHLVSGQNLGEEEYASILQSLKEPDSFLFLFPQTGEEIECKRLYLERKHKLELVVKCAFCAVVAVQLHNDAYPINIYEDKKGPFSQDKRGRTLKGNPESLDTRDKQSVRPMTLGIMNSFMPVYGPLKTTKPSSYIRPTDKCKPVDGSEWVEKLKVKKIIPFVNSLSGTLLMQLRLSKGLLDEDAYPYANNPKQLGLFYKAFVASMLYSSGGHCLNEFMEVFELPEIKKAFHSVPGFDGISTSAFFLDGAGREFMKSLNSTIEYNDVILNKKALAEEVSSYSFNL